MQVILDSSFAHPGSAPIWGGKKGEFRDWTSVCHGFISVVSGRSYTCINISNATLSSGIS